MRYYKIQISDASSDAPAGSVNGAANFFAAPIVSNRVGALLTWNPASAPSAPAPTVASSPQWSSMANGVNDPGALDIEFEITDDALGNIQAGWLKVYGIDPKQISQAANYTGKRIQLWGGFSAGLPLANLQVPHQGLIMDGEIYPCWGNWVGNELSIEFTVINGAGSGPGGPTKPINFIHNMPKSQPLSTAKKNTLTTAFPGSAVNVNISPKLMLNYDDKGFYQGIEQYFNYIKSLSHSILGTPDKTGYRGVRVHTIGNNINVGDETIVGTLIPIQFEDLIGQPTWIGNEEIQIKTCLRSDIVAIDGKGIMQVTLPQNTVVTTTEGGAASAMGYKVGDVLNFQGTFSVNTVRHIGHYRQPTGDAWVSIIDCTPNSGSGGGGGGNGGTPLGQGGIGHQ
jgi:hypothetical protein